MIVDIVVAPKSGRFAVVRKDHMVKIFLRSPPENNKANLELIKELSKLLGTDVRLVSGQTSKRKRLAIDMSEDEWQKFLVGLE